MSSPSPVSHHDTEIPFNPSFIESPSAAWVSDSSFSSFDTDNEGPEYSVPPREGDVHGSSSSSTLHITGMGAGHRQYLFSYPCFPEQGQDCIWPPVMTCAWCGQPHCTTSSWGNTPRDNPLASAPGLTSLSMSPGTGEVSSSPNSCSLPLQASRCWGVLSCRMGCPQLTKCSQTHLPSTVRTCHSPSASLALPASPRPSGPLCPLLRGQNSGQQRPPAPGGSPRPHGAHPSCLHHQGMQHLNPQLSDQPAVATRALSHSARGKKATDHLPGPPRGDAGAWSLAPGM